MRSVVWVVACGGVLCGLWACGGASPATESTTSADDEAELFRDPVLDAVVAENATRRPRHAVPTNHREDAPAPTTASGRPRSDVGVRGITGSLTAFEVDEAMGQRTEELMACVSKRPARFSYVSGDIRFHIVVRAQGGAERVYIVSSDIGEPALEECLRNVVLGAAFPAPAGQQQADAAWQMNVQPLGHFPEPIDPASLDEALLHQSEATYEQCQIARNERFAVTGYVSARGALTLVRVRPAWRGPRQVQEPDAAQMSCLSDALRAWSKLPKPHRIAKVHFELHFQPAPPPPPRASKRGAPSKRPVSSAPPPRRRRS